jgi:ribonucleotide reductase alpha subunit
MQEMLGGDENKQELWIEVLKTRYETGEPYLFFSDNVNDANPECYKQNGLKVQGSNICCLSGDTLVVTKTGISKIEDLCGKEVELWDGLNWVKNDTVSQRGVDKLFRIKFNGGFHVDCNANHRWFVLKPEYSENDLFNLKYPGLGKSLPVEFYTEILAKDLKVGIELESVPFSGREKKNQFVIESIEELPGEHPVYCPTLPTTGKFALANGLMTGNTEITLHTDDDHSFVCCLSSLNLAKYDEWKDTDTVYLATWFLDGVMQEFIEKARELPGFERSVRFAEKSRALGLGVLGFHTLLQQKMIPFDSMETFMLNSEIFRLIKKESDRATIDLAKEYGEPEWCKGFGIRNSHRVALAPTVSNAVISGNVSPSIEPWTSNAFAKKTAKGTFIHKNKQLEQLLTEKNKNTEEVWKSIFSNNGSVQHLDFLSENEKKVFLTAREINQFVILKLASQRQKWIDQAQSINLFFPANVDPNYFHEVHVEAWRQKLKTIYYCRTEAVLKGEVSSRDYEKKDILKNEESSSSNKKSELYSRSASECAACEG